MSRFHISYVFLLIVVTCCAAFSDKSALSKKTLADTYPVPPQNDRSLFYLQRSKNTNAIVYEVNVLPSGKIDADNPLKIYWMQYATDSSMAELNYVQRRYAYGINAVPVNGHPGQFVLNFVSYEKKKFYLISDPDGKRFRTFASINGKMSELKRIFIHLDGGTFWFPNITDVEIVGKDPSTQQLIVEHFKP
ncbi:MAG: DUF4833 domain-containing protein [Bacteroidia bacterium]